MMQCRNTVHVLGVELTDLQRTIDASVVKMACVNVQIYAQLGAKESAKSFNAISKRHSRQNQLNV